MSAKTDDAGAGAAERERHIRLSQKVATRAPEVVLGKKLDGDKNSMEKVRSPGPACGGLKAPAKRVLCSSMFGGWGSCCSGWSSATRRSARRRRMRTLSTRGERLRSAKCLCRPVDSLISVACSANPIYKLSWGEKCEGAEYPAQSNVPEEVKQAYAARDTDDTYYSLQRMMDGMLAATADERWTLETVMVQHHWHPFISLRV